MFVGPAALIAAGCASADPAPKPIGTPNPAAVNCTRLGGKSGIVTAADGSQYGMCHLADGRVCDEWPLLRDGSCVARTN